MRISTRASLLVSSAALAAVAAAAASQDVPRPSRGSERFALRVVATGLEAPWEIAWGPDEHLWVTERRGARILRINPADGSRSIAASVTGVHQSVSQDGLLGLALHPDLLRGSGNDYVYVAFTYDADPSAVLARRLAIRRYSYDGGSGTLSAPQDLLTGLPAHDDHVGGRLAFGADRTLYLGIGDQGSNFGQNRCTANRAQELPTAADVSAQDWSKYQGKIIRVNLDGSIPADNPTIEGVRSHVYSYGHRNPLGLAFLGDRLYASEHGPSSDDEVNLIEAGRNYGWPNVAGFRDDKSYVYGNWSASRPEPCTSLLSVNVDRIPASVPLQKETDWAHPDFAPPLTTFYTVETGYDFARQGNATIAPGGLDVYRSSSIPGWNNSLLVLSLLRGAVFRVPLSPDGRGTSGPPAEHFKSTDRYRDIAVHPDGRTFYLVTDGQGRSTDASGAISRTLDHPDALLEFRYLP